MKHGTPQAILDAAAQIAAVADRLSAAFARELRAVLRQTERALPVLLADATPADPPTRQALRRALRKAGFDALASGAYGPALDPVIKRVLAARRTMGLDAVLTPSMSLQLEAFGALYRIDLLGEGDVAARALWRATVRGVFGGSDVRVIMDELALILDRTEPQIRTLYDTSVSVLGRQVEALQADPNPDTRFVFVGPIDDVTRPWCLDHVGRVYTREEIDRLDNGQIGPVFLTGGGYNCRHVWQELSRASALWDMAGTRERVPEVRDQLERLRKAA